MNKVGMLGSLVGAVALMGAGCMVNRDYYQPLEEGDYQYFEDPSGGFARNLDLVGGNIRGDVGPVTNVDHEATILDGYDDGSFSDVQVIAETDRGVAMNWVEIVGGVNHPALRPGFSQTFSENDYGYDSRSVHIRIVNCAGDQAYDWTYDQPADEVDVSVEEGPSPDIVRVNYTARTFEVDPFTGVREPSATTVTGSFDVRR